MVTIQTLICYIYMCRNEAEIVQNLDDIYSVGTFAQVHEVQDLGNRMRLVVMAHRRIKIVNQIFEDGNAKPGQGKRDTYALHFYVNCSRVHCKD